MSSIAFAARSDELPEGEPVDASRDETEQQDESAEPVVSGDDDGAGLMVDSMETLVKTARSCLLIRDWKCAASQYENILTEYPEQPESSPMLISLAKIELRHLNLPREALTHYRLYLTRAPTGPLAEDAYIGMAYAYRGLGFKEKEKETLRGFLERFPSSLLVGIVRDRLRQLSDPFSF